MACGLGNYKKVAHPHPILHHRNQPTSNYQPTSKMNRSRESRREYGDIDREEWRMRRGSRREEDIGLEEKVHVVCVDDLAASRRALRFALKNVPRNHRLLLVHGNYESRIADTLTERPPIEEIRSNFLRLCKEEGVRATTTQHDTHTSHSTTLTTLILQRACEFKSFDYRSNRDFGDKVCSLARRQGAKVPLPATTIRNIAPMIVS